MEDILASIRRVLSEEEEAEAAEEAAPEPEPDSEPAPEPPVMSQPGEIIQPVAPPPAGDDVLELTEAMIAPADALMSGQTVQMSSDVLGELARAIMDRREMGPGDRDVTLEGMVREMLRPQLREWLDRNLPYLIERLVKKEIDKMVNRAEMFEDL